MDKKTPYKAYYFAAVEEITSPQIKAIKTLPEVEISSVKQRMDKYDIYGIIQGTSEYHRRIQNCPAAPYIIFAKGSMEVLDRPALAIVGPRDMSPYAQHILECLFEYLQYYDVTTVSGMASGVDTLCHELSLQYNIPTVAVLGGGFQQFVRGRKRELIERIVHHGGLILSEYKHGFVSTNWSFPQRNRLIAGLADVIFLPEAQEKSGSLITADVGHKLGKPICAPMQHIFAVSSAGTNSYIAAGTITPIHDLQLFTDKYFDRKSSVVKTADDYSTEEMKIINAIDQYNEISIEQLIAVTSYTSSELFIHVTTLEMKGIVYESSPGMYMKKSLH